MYNLIDDRCYRVNLYLFCLFNWLGDFETSTRFIALTFCVLTMVSAVVFQVEFFIVQGVNLISIIRGAPAGMCTVGSFFALLITYSNKERLRCLLEMIQEFYEEEDSEEVRAIKKYSLKLLTIALRVITRGGLGTLVFLCTSFNSSILDLIVPLNETRQKVLVFDGEFFVDKDKYFYHILLYEFVGTWVVVLVIGSMLNMIIVAFFAVCTFYSVVGHKLKSIGPLLGEKSMDERYVYNKIVHCTMKHRTAIEFVWVLNQCGELLICIGLVMTIVMFTLTMVQITDPQLVQLKSILFAIGQLADFVIGCLCGQYLMDSSVALAEKLYDSRWYECSPHLQRLLLLILMKVQQPAHITLKGLLILCNKSLGTVLQTAISYCMVLKQFK